MNSQNELKQVMEERQAMYRFLAGVYRREIDQELLAKMCDMGFPASTGNPEIDLGFQMLGRYLRASTPTTLTELAIEYTRIFLGTGPSQAGGAFPFELVYTSPRGLLMQEARDQVVELYRQKGIQRSSAFHAAEDHLALELEFLAQLCGKTAQALAECEDCFAASTLQEQNVFLEKHLLNWVPRLCEDIMRIASTDFYKGIAMITAGYLAIDKNLIAELLMELQAA